MAAVLTPPDLFPVEQGAAVDASRARVCGTCAHGKAPKHGFVPCALTPWRWQRPELACHQATDRWAPMTEKARAKRDAQAGIDQAVAAADLSVPLSDTAIRILREARACDKHGHRRLCFTYYGDAVEQPANSAWLKALDRARERCAQVGLDIDEDFTWHCLRHTWATWHVMGLMSPDGRQTPLEVLQKLGGWRDIRMVQRYAHLARDYTAQYAGDPGLSTAQPTKAPELTVVAA